MLPTALHTFHQRHGAKLVDFAGYALPLQYSGIIKEHLHTRAAASLFDVSHMGQALISPERLRAHVAVDLDALASGKQVYAQLLNEHGGIVDDLMLSRDISEPEFIYIVVNGARKAVDFARLQPERQLDEFALLALQGPQAVAACADLLGAPSLREQRFMQQRLYTWQGHSLRVARSGYSGEDGVEVSLANAIAAEFAEALLSAEAVAPAGLGARDSLRIEAGLCLYGNDIDEDTTPVEAGLRWSLNLARLRGGACAGATRLLEQINSSVARKRVGLQLEGKQAARAGSEIFHQGRAVGKVTSGCYAPSLGHAVAMGYVATAAAQLGAEFSIEQRGRSLPARLVPMPFHPHNYYKGQ